MNKQTLSKIIAGAGVIAAFSVVIPACSPAAARITPTWINPQTSGNTVSISAAEVQKDTIVHFKAPGADGKTMTFMAYNFDGNTYVRGDICPSCGSTSFSLVGDTLVCNTCSTVFYAKNGEGKSGACVAFPKAGVNFQTDNGNLVMNVSDLTTAYQNTISPGLP